MASHPPPKHSKRERIREALRDGTHWLEHAFQSSSSRLSSLRFAASTQPSDPARPSSPTPSATSSKTATTAIQPTLHPASRATGKADDPSAVSADLASVGSQTQPTAEPERSTGDKLKEAGSLAWSGLEMALRVLEKTSDGFPPLKAAVSGFLACLDIVQDVAANRQDYKELATELKSLIDTLSEYVSEIGSEDRSGSIANITLSIEKEAEHIKEKQARGKAIQVIESTEDKEDVIKSYRRVEASFRQLQNTVALQILRTTNKQLEITLLEGMSPVEEARYDSSYSTALKRRGCTAETRENVQADLQEWVQDPEAAKVYWMNGMAGTGKTTIAYSLCEWLEANKQLGANFFCSRTKDSCRDVNRIVPTIARQLARYSPAFRSALCKVLESDTGVSKRNVVQQFEKLVKEPLLEVKATIPEGVVVVIDALDECEDSHGVRLVLATLLRLAAGLPLKFFVSSRPEPAIQDRMRSSSDYSPAMLHLHDIEESIVEEDIKKYLTEALSRMSPSDDQIRQLAKQSGKLFIYAATLARYILPDNMTVSSSTRLKTILAAGLQSAGKTGSAKKYKELDALYATILAAAFNDSLEEEEVDVMQLVLWTVVCAREPMTPGVMASLLDLDKVQLWSALQPLQSVLHVSEGTGIVSTLHASFPDYMLDRSRSDKFYCDEPRHCCLLSDRCFEVMKEQLRFNICNLGSSYVFDKDVPDLGERVTKLVSPTLFYACRYWGEHLRRADSSSVALCDQLVDFLTHRLLFWMEVLNLRQCSALGAPLLLAAHNWLLKNHMQVDVRQYVVDAEDFVTRFAGSACALSTPHIYISALAFCTKSSSVYAHYWGRTKGLINVKGTAMNRRAQAAIATWATGSAVETAIFSPDTGRVVSGSKDGNIQVWDAHTGDLIARPFRGHTGPIRSAAFSPDGARIVSGSDDFTVCVWDFHTGDLFAGPLEGHTNSVRSVAFSPDGSRIVSGSDDRTARVWAIDTHTSNFATMQYHREHTGSVYSVAFSPDGTRIVSGSGDWTIRVWNPHSGDLIAGPFRGHTGSVRSVAFSPNGTHIASGSSDRTIRVWDALTGNSITGPFEGHTDYINSVAFSPDGSHAASGSNDRTIRVWDVCTGDLVAGPFEGHTAWVKSVAFSLDGSRIVSGGSDSAIWVWHAHPGDPGLVPFEGHTSAVKMVAFSPDGMHILSGSNDETFRLWSADTGDLVAGPFKVREDSSHSALPHRLVGTNAILDGSAETHIAYTDTSPPSFQDDADSPNLRFFSPDATHMITLSTDALIRVRDARTGDLAFGPFKWCEYSEKSKIFSPDGTRIISVHEDYSIQVCDTHTGALVADPLRGHTDWVNSVTFSPDATRIVSGSDDAIIRLWKVHNDTGGRSSTTQTNSSLSVATPDGIDSGSDHSPVIRNANLDSQDDSIRNLNNDWEFSEDGWITTNAMRLFWVPPNILTCMPHPPHPFVIGRQGSIRVENWDLLLGNHWSKCYPAR